MSSDQDKEINSSEEKLDNTKEETEDTTEYYAQGDSKEDYNEESEFSRPVPSIDKSSEEISLVKAVAYLGFGLAALAIVFILFFIRDLDHRVGGVGSALSSLEEKIEPLRKEVKASLEQVNTDINGLKITIEDRDKKAAVMELKRALVAIQSMALSDTPKVEAKSDEVIASIEALLGEFGGGEATLDDRPIQVPAGKIDVQEAPDLIELPIVEQSSEVHSTPPTSEVIADIEPLSNEAEDLVESADEIAESESLELKNNEDDEGGEEEEEEEEEDEDE